MLPTDSLQELHRHFKKRLAKCREVEAPAIRKEWSAAVEAFHATHALSAIEDVDAYYQVKLAAAGAEDQSAIRLAWANAKADYYERRWKLSTSAPNGAERPIPTAAAMPDSEAEAIEEARRQYGQPLGAVMEMGRVGSSEPTPIEIRLPIVEIQRDKESQ